MAGVGLEVPTLPRRLQLDGEGSGEVDIEVNKLSYEKMLGWREVAAILGFKGE
jgi:hypothetical protein